MPTTRHNSVIQFKCIGVEQRLNTEIMSAEALKLKCQHKNCINKASCNLNHIIILHGIFV